MNNINKEVSVLAAISQVLEDDYQGENQEWVGSPFAWIKTRPSRQIGAIGQKLVAGWLAAKGFSVGPSGDSEANRIIEGKRVAIKFSTRWASGGYKFQQIRDQRYDIVICLGVSPFDAHCWVIPKKDIIRLWKVENKISSQHGGREGADTAWLSIRVDNPPEWLNQYGGSLSDATLVLSKITGLKVKTSMKDKARSKSP